MASSLGSNPSMEDVDDEIAFQRVRLATLDPDALDYEPDKTAIELELKRLEDMLQTMQSSDPSTQTFESSYHPTSFNNERQPGGPLFDTAPRTSRIAPIMSSPRLQPPTYNCPSSLALQNNMKGKRPFDDGSSHYDTNNDGYSSNRSSKRATPSPAAYYASLPNPIDKDGESDPDMWSFLDPDQTSEDRALADRRKRERARFERMEQMRRDEEFARSLAQDAPRPSSTQFGSQAVLNSNGTFRKPSSGKPAPSVGISRSPFDVPLPTSSRHYSSSSFANPSPSTSATMYTFGTGKNDSIKREPAGFGSSSTQLPQESASYSSDDSDDSDDSDLQFSTADAYNLASANKQPRQTMPGGFPVASNSRHLSTPNHYSGPTAGPSAYQGYTTYNPHTNVPPPIYGGYGMPESFQQAMRAAGSMFSHVQGGFRDNMSELRDLFHQNSLPYGSSSANPYEGLGYRSTGSDSTPRAPFNPRDVVDLDNDPDPWGYDRVHLTDAQQMEELKNLIDNIRETDDSDPALREPTPEALKEDLYPHQRIGLAWMKRMEEGSNKGGILADDMGLGKTIQALSLMVSRPSQDPRRKTTLIVAPVALMRQWATEITTKLKPSQRHQLSVWIQHGARKKNKFRDLREFDVVLTTFGSLAVELKKRERWQEIQSRDPNAIPTPRERLALLADEAKWYRVIIDEAQCIKNRSTQSSKAASQLDATYRWCMTGTPMMNGIEDLYAQLRFLHVGPFDDWHRFRDQFITRMTRTSSEARREESMRKFQALLKAILLRRTKTSEIDGKPILQLPPRIVEIEHTIFSQDEMDFYKSLEHRAQITVNRYLKEGTVMRHYSNILVLLLRLRQACCHPHLIKDYAQAVSIEGIPPEQRIALAKELAPAVIERIIAANGEFECPVCYDATENPALMIPCGHDTCSECWARITDPAAAIADGDGDGNNRAKCPQCREKADSNRFIDYNTFKQVHQPELWAQQHPEEAEEDGADDGEDSDADSETMSEAGVETESETESLGGFIVDDNVGTDDDDDLDRKPSVKKEKKPAGEEKKVKKAKKSKRSKGKEKKKETTLGELRKLAQRNKKSKQRYLRRLRREWITSAKIEKTLQILKDTEQNDPTEKTIIFSQFTSLLDLLEVPIDDMGFTYERYDGSMNAGMRADAVHNFMTKPNCRVILVSLKAGNAGLNLTAASSVIILDPFWNPYVEEQAIDRAHRIGQRRDVKVHRVLIEETVEDRIIKLQEQKREVIGTALDENASRDLSRLGVGQIRFLFGLGGQASARG